MAFTLFMVSSVGRAIRIVAGLILIGLGLFGIGNSCGWLLAAVGLVPLVAGVADFCLFAPLFGEPFWGKDVRNGRVQGR